MNGRGLGHAFERGPEVPYGLLESPLPQRHLAKPRLGRPGVPG